MSVKLVKMPKHKLVRHCSTGRALYSDKARSFSQSERALYRNFIIKQNRAQSRLLYLLNNELVLTNHGARISLNIL